MAGGPADGWKQATSSPADDEEEEEDEGLMECEGARLELEDLLDALQAYYTHNWHTHAAKQVGPTTFPPLPPKVARSGCALFTSSTSLLRLRALLNLCDGWCGRVVWRCRISPLVRCEAWHISSASPSPTYDNASEDS